MTRDNRIARLRADLNQARQAKTMARMPHEIAVCQRRIMNISMMLSDAISRPIDATFELNDWHYAEARTEARAA
jgi:hypothetical protein